MTRSAWRPSRRAHSRTACPLRNAAAQCSCSDRLRGGIPHAALRCRLPMPLTDAAYRCRLPMPLTDAAYRTGVPVGPVDGHRMVEFAPRHLLPTLPCHHAVPSAAQALNRCASEQSSRTHTSCVVVPQSLSFRSEAERFLEEDRSPTKYHGVRPSRDCDSIDLADLRVGCEWSFASLWMTRDRMFAPRVNVRQMTAQVPDRRSGDSSQETGAIGTTGVAGSCSCARVCWARNWPQAAAISTPRE